MALPANPVLGDTFTEAGVTYTFNGVTWTEGWAKTIGGVDVIADNDAPSSPSVGTQWIDLTTNQIKEYDGSDWNVVRTI